MGDFNINVNDTSDLVNDLLALMALACSYGYEQLVGKNTCMTDYSSFCLDHVYFLRVSLISKLKQLLWPSQ